MWTRPGSTGATRSLLNLVMLTALNRSHELAVHVRGAITNGATVAEIQETLLQATVYSAPRPRSRRSGSPRGCVDEMAQDQERTP